MKKNFRTAYEESTLLLDAAYECLPDREIPGIRAALHGFSYFSPNASDEEKQTVAKRDEFKRGLSALPLLGRFFPNSTKLDPRAAFILQEELRNAVEFSRAILLGYETPRRANSEPVEIPLDALEGEINWEKATIVHGSMAFEAVRVLLSGQLSESTDELREPELAADKPERGRPGYTNWLHLSARKLLQDGAISRDNNDDASMIKIRDAAAREIREMLEKMEKLPASEIRKKLPQDLKDIKPSKYQPKTK